MKHFRKIMAFVTALALLISILPAGALATIGSTATDDYILVKTWEELINGVKEGGKFKLNNDIAAAEIVFIGETDVTMVEPVQVVGTDSSQVGLSDSDFEIGIVPDIVPWLEIPDGVSVTIDLNGHTLSCLGIGVGELKPTTLCVESSNAGGKLTISGVLTVYGNVSFENCAVSTMIFDGGIGEMVLKNASLKMEAASSMPIEEMEGGLLWEGSGIALFGNSTIDINGMFLSFGETTKVSIEAGSKITNIPSVYAWGNDVSADLEKFSSTIEDYAAAAGFTLAVDKEGECIIFLDESEKQVESGSLKGVTQLTDTVTDVSIDDQVYNERVKEFTVTVNGKTLKEGEDYDLAIMDASGNSVTECKDAGKYTVTVTGKGDYAGTVTKQVEIAREDALYEPPKKPIDGTQSLSEQYEDLGLPYCNTTIENIGNSTSLSTSVGLNSQITLAGSWKFENVANITMDSGKYDASAVFTPDNKNYNEVKTTVEISTWGAEVNVGTETSPAWNYEARSGVTSASITDGITWIKEESGGVTTWYGIDNSKNVFAKGSKFSVQKLSEKENNDEWNKYLAKLDEAQKKLIENNKLDIFLVSVDGPDGKAYTSLSGPTEFYIQLGDGWDKEKLQALFISDSVDETYTIEIVEMVLPDGTKAKMAKMTLNHFSPYALMAISLPDPSPETGDTSRILLWIMLAVLSCGAMSFAAVYNRKRRKA